MEDIEKIEYWLREFGMPEENIENCATQIAQGYGACRYLDGVSAGAEAVKELEKKGEASEDLEEEIHKEIIKLHTAPCYDELKAFALHFAEWQKKKMMKNVVEVNLDELMDLLEAEKEETGIGLSEYDAGYENGRMKVINSLTEKIKAL